MNNKNSDTQTCCEEKISQPSAGLMPKQPNITFSSFNKIVDKKTKDQPSIQQSKPVSKKEDSCCSSDKCGPETPVIKQETDILLDYLVSGMDCPSCSTTIVNRLTQMTGVTRCEVNFSAGTMQVSLNEASAQPSVVNAVKKLGFSLELVQNHSGEDFTIYGMDCGACAVTLEKHMRKLIGVESVTVNFSSGMMSLKHNLLQEKILAEVKKAGYQAQPISEASSSQQPGRFNGLGNVIISGVALVVGFMLSYLNVDPVFSTLLYAVAIVAGGLKPLRSAWYAVLSRSLDMNVLMCSAAIGAAIIGEWLEGASVVLLFSLGTALQTRSIEKTRKSIRSLMMLAPESANIYHEGKWITMPVSQVKPDDVMLVKPGDRLPLDGVVLKGESSVNQAPITGESIPADKTIGSEVYAGSINHNGVLEVRITRPASDTALARIIHMVEDAQSRKSPMQGLVERFSVVYTPVVFIIALLIMFLPPLLGLGDWAEWFYRGLELLVVACPCALVISTPVAIVSAIGNAARNGILVKGGITLEKLGAIRALAFDKTGTLTEGKPRVTSWEAFSGNDQTLLSIALSIEAHSSHPLASAVSQFAREHGGTEMASSAQKTIPGKGETAEINSEVWFAGNEKLFSEIDLPKMVRDKIEQLKLQGATLVLLGTKQKVAGIFAISDTIRSTTIEALKELKIAGITHTLMLTGDNEGTAKTIAKEANIDAWRANLMPEDKVSVIEEWQEKGIAIAMIGDGINDAPALAAANIGIAMGGAGTDSAIETADVVLMSDQLEKLPHAFALSRLTSAIIMQNIVFSLAVKVIALALIFPGWLTLWMAVLSDTGAALIVILNSLRLLRFSHKRATKKSTQK